MFTIHYIFHAIAIMSSANNKKSYIHSLKGPERLSPEMVKDIVESRGTPNARKELAKKHGISETRVGRLWTEYYGGGKLSDFKSGIKKPLPSEPINNADITLRRIKTERGEYKAREPKIEKIDPKVDAKKRAAPSKIYKPSKDLVLNESAIDDMSDRDAELIAGEIGAGNNNPQLNEIFNKLIESRDRDTAYLYKLAKNGLKNNYNDDLDYSTVDETDDDDSTAYYNTKNRGVSNADSMGCKKIHGWIENAENSENSRPFSVRGQSELDANNTSMVLRNNSVRRSEEAYSGNPREYQSASRSGARAQPVYIGHRSESEEFEQEQERSKEPSRYESKVSSSEHDPSQRSVQQNNAHNINKYISKSEQSIGVSGRSGNGSCQTVPGIPWLKLRQY